MSNLEGLDSEQLKERLLVAETIMKKLYVRNKELEDFHHDNVIRQKQSESLHEASSHILDHVSNEKDDERHRFNES